MRKFRFQQPSQPDALRRQWRAFVRTGLESQGVSQIEAGAAARVHPSYVSRYMDGYVPSRAKVKLFGEALGNVAGAQIAAGLIPDAGLDSPFSENVRELLCILTFLDPEEQDGLITARVLDAVRLQINRTAGRRREAC